MKRLLILGLSLFSSSVLHAAFEESCLEFFHVRRPIAGGAVDHEFIGVRAERGAQAGEFFVFGLPKAGSDIHYFEAEWTKAKPTVRSFGTACGDRAGKAWLTAETISERLQRKNQAWLYYIPRMLVTPLAGKPCGNAAAEIKRAIMPFLE